MSNDSDGVQIPVNHERLREMPIFAEIVSKNAYY